jgi:hypothetical protein
MATQASVAPTLEYLSAAEKNANLLDRIVERQADVASRYQPVMEIDDAIKRYEALKRYIERVLIDGVDYGKVPGVDKPFLFKPGAQKLCMLFGYVPHYESRVQIEDWSGEKFGESLFYYQYACVLTKDGKPVGEGIGSANSWESKYRYRWVSEDDAKRIPGWEKFPRRAGSIKEFTFAVDKAETSGPYGKPAEYWQRFKDAIESGEARKVKKAIRSGEMKEAWEIGGSMVRVPNDQFPDIINTCQKQGEKRAYVEATLSATGASQFFTQDEDSIEALSAAGIDTGGHPAGTQAAADAVAERKIAEMKAKPTTAEKSKDYQMLEAFGKIKKQIGDRSYYTILGNNGFEHANEITDVRKARAVYGEMAGYLKSMRQAEPTAEPQPAAAMTEQAEEVWTEGRE